MDSILGFPQLVGAIGLIALMVIAIGFVILVVKCYRKIEQGKAIVRNGIGGTRVSFSGIVVVPVIHRFEEMDISLKRIEIYRHGEDGLVCMDNIRADIKVAFFVRVNKTSDDVLRVAQSIGCSRASDQQALVELFDAKFSEALKTAGKQFDFTDLYSERERFKEEILKVVGTDLNGFVLDDAAIDYLEQTPLLKLDENNILDAEGIKKITKLTAEQKILANEIQQNKEKTITKENVEAREAILEMERQLAETEERQKREIANIKAREEAEAKKVSEEERLKAEQARIASDQEIGISEENKDRQIIVAQKNKERTKAIETERLEKDRLLEATERERIVTLTQIEKEKTIESEKKNIQEVIRERVELEKTVVAERERTKDVEAFASADREKKVVVTRAEMTAEEALVRDIKAAEAAKKAAELKAEEEKYQQLVAAQAAREVSDLKAEEILVLADAEEKAAEKEANAVKLRAEAKTADIAALGMAEVSVTQARAEAIRQQGEAEANVMQLKFSAEAKGITEKADAMKEFDSVGREHEEFKLCLNKDKEIELAEINVQKGIAEEQAKIVGEALKSARIDIVGGDAAFFDKIVSSVAQGKAIDRAMENSRVLTDVKETFFNGDSEYFKSQFKDWIQQFGLSSDDLKNMSISAILLRMMSETTDGSVKATMQRALQLAADKGLAEKTAVEVLGKLSAKKKA
ncbi:MAG: Inner membrane protein YqiK [Verrucomicrobia subdivision 3 bacterium]|nr:Inner membrane protein YqiK [Limisphaerales bacterium]MCS1413521.1 Inner membrane protein YqiK [Limisphaerales bacterium]